MAGYISVIYDEKSHPVTSYPEQLSLYLFQSFGLKAGMRMLEPGCGRGDFLLGFQKLGLECHGLDQSEEAKRFLAGKGIEVGVCNVEREPLPFADESFDVVYQKSLLEHLRDPDIFMREAMRVLKPGGLLLSLVPDWEANYKIYFDDFTHRTPFTVVSLADIYRMCDFERINAIKFRQLPIVWRYPALNYLCAALAPFVPVRTKNKFLRWSRELMLIGSGYKPKGAGEPVGPDND